jgi:hypothetical protein
VGHKFTPVKAEVLAEQLAAAQSGVLGKPLDLVFVQRTEIEVIAITGAPVLQRASQPETNPSEDVSRIDDRRYAEEWHEHHDGISKAGFDTGIFAHPS